MSVNSDNAIDFVNACDRIADAIHECSSKISDRTSQYTRNKKQPWWNQNCSIEKNRVRLWHSIWNKAIRDGRPRPPRHQGFIAIFWGFYI